MTMGKKKREKEVTSYDITLHDITQQNIKDTGIKETIEGMNLSNLILMFDYYRNVVLLIDEEIQKRGG